MESHNPAVPKKNLSIFNRVSTIRGTIYETFREQSFVVHIHIPMVQFLLPPRQTLSQPPYSILFTASLTAFREFSRNNKNNFPGYRNISSMTSQPCRLNSLHLRKSVHWWNILFSQHPHSWTQTLPKSIPFFLFVVAEHQRNKQFLTISPELGSTTSTSEKILMEEKKWQKNNKK